MGKRVGNRYVIHKGDDPILALQALEDLTIIEIELPNGVVIGVAEDSTLIIEDIQALQRLIYDTYPNVDSEEVKH